MGKEFVIRCKNKSDGVTWLAYNGHTFKSKEHAEGEAYSCSTIWRDKEFTVEEVPSTEKE